MSVANAKTEKANSLFFRRKQWVLKITVANCVSTADTPLFYCDLYLSYFVFSKSLEGRHYFKCLLSKYVYQGNPHFNDHAIGIHPHPRKPTLHFSITQCFSLSFSDCHESGRKPLESLVKGLNVLSIVLKVWSSKGEVSTGWWVACVIPTLLQIWSSDSLQFL